MGATPGQKLALTTFALAGSEILFAATHSGGIGVVLGIGAGLIAWNCADDLFNKEGEEDSPSSAPQSIHRPRHAPKLLVGKSARGQWSPGRDFPTDEDVTEHMRREKLDDDDDFNIPQFKPGTFTFSHLLATGWRPSFKEIFLARLPNGTNIFVTVEDLVHIALSGATRNGKTSLIRQLLSQLIYVGCVCILLDPHYTPYDVEIDEDWTPFASKLRLDPMECKDYARIGEVLGDVANTILPKRKQLRRQSKPMGKPIFIVIDEYPAIVAKCPHAQEYIALLLREGAKFKIFLCIASHDFQVKTAFPDVGGGIRDCFKTVLHVGGDIHTVRALLDIEKVDRAEEASLGKGRVYLRCETHKQAGLANTPWMDNEAIFELVGPSTYVEDDDVEIDLDDDDDPLANVRTHSPLRAETDRQEATIKPNIPDRGPKAADRIILGKDSSTGQDVTITREEFRMAVYMRKNGMISGHRDLMPAYSLSEHHAKALNKLIRQALELDTKGEREREAERETEREGGREGE
jgi:hypothetical protein